LSVTSDSSQAFRAFVQSEIDRYGKVIRAAGITAD
jgi:tripartite-type tricarboxylate transporter receptor subunit TctC